jgi:hypothetical protein
MSKRCRATGQGPCRPFGEDRGLGVRKSLSLSLGLSWTLPGLMVTGAEGLSWPHE